MWAEGAHEGGAGVALRSGTGVARAEGEGAARTGKGSSEQGESVQYVQRMLGHASITLTVDTYGKWLPMGNKAAVDKLDGIPGATHAVAVGAVESSSAGNGSRVVADEPATASGLLQVIEEAGDPGRARTFNPEIKSLLLYH